VSHDEPGAADHSSVDWDVLFDPTQSNSGLSPGYFILLILVFQSVSKLGPNVCLMMEREIVEPRIRCR